LNNETHPVKKTGWAFWLTVLAISAIFMLIHESGQRSDTQHVDRSSDIRQPDEGHPSVTGISQAPKLISDNQGKTGSITVPFSRLIKTDPVNDILVDPRGITWVATEKGLCSIKDDQVTFYSLEDGSFPFPQAESLAYDGKILWVGTMHGLCAQNEAGRFVRSELSNTLPSQIIWSLAWDGTTLWAGTQNGAAFLKPGGTFQPINEDNTNGGLRNNWCRKIARLSSWFVAAHDRGLSIWNINFPASNPELWKNIDHARSAITRPITDLAFDGRHVWLSTARGVLQLTTPAEHFFSEFIPNLVSFSKIHGLPSNRVNSIIAHRSAIWAGTDDGLVRIKDEKILLVSSSTGLSQNCIRKLASSGDILWIGTDKGIQFINTAMVD
jgi:ligand-binding sensor domain-containing protein